MKDRLLSSTAAIAGNGLIAGKYCFIPPCLAFLLTIILEYDDHDTIYQFTSRNITCAEERQAFSGMGQIAQLVAYETGFVALSRDGSVWTWGDERYSSCLGRPVTSSRYETWITSHEGDRANIVTAQLKDLVL